MIRYLTIFTFCIAVPVAMAGVLVWFLRKLRHIEKERWGDKAQLNEESPITVIKRLIRKKKS